MSAGQESSAPNRMDEAWLLMRCALDGDSIASLSRRCLTCFPLQVGVDAQLVVGFCGLPACFIGLRQKEVDGRFSRAFLLRHQQIGYRFLLAVQLDQHPGAVDTRLHEPRTALDGLIKVSESVLGRTVRLQGGI